MPEWLQKKLIEPSQIEEKIKAIRSGKKLVTLNGSFDLLHAGHLYILHEAKKQGDLLLVALNSDRSIQQYKGPKRPIVPLRYRLEMMAAIEWVDFVTWFEETDPRTLLAKIRPETHVNGAEYGMQCIEAETVLGFGGRLHLVDRIPSLATTTLIEKIKQCV